MFCRTFELRTFSANDLASSAVSNSILTNTSLGLLTPRRSVWPLAACLRPRGSWSNCCLKASKSPSITPTMKAIWLPPVAVDVVRLPSLFDGRVALPDEVSAAPEDQSRRAALSRIVARFVAICGFEEIYSRSVSSAPQFRGIFPAALCDATREGGLRGCLRRRNDSTPNERNHDEEVRTESDDTPMAQRSGTACRC